MLRGKELERSRMILLGRLSGQPSHFCTALNLADSFVRVKFCQLTIPALQRRQHLTALFHIGTNEDTRCKALKDQVWEDRVKGKVCVSLPPLEVLFFLLFLISAARTKPPGITGTPSVLLFKQHKELDKFYSRQKEKLINSQFPVFSHREKKWSCMPVLWSETRCVQNPRAFLQLRGDFSFKQAL